MPLSASHTIVVSLIEFGGFILSAPLVKPYLAGTVYSQVNLY